MAGIDKRLSDSIAGVIYNGSQYSKRNVIGSLDVLKTFKYPDIQAFYKTWYRPDLQCVMIVGDIDPAAYEQKVQKLFASLPHLAMLRHALPTRLTTMRSPSTIASQIRRTAHTPMGSISV